MFVIGRNHEIPYPRARGHVNEVKIQKVHLPRCQREIQTAMNGLRITSTMRECRMSAMDIMASIGSNELHEWGECRM
jgi:hypothetical protein